MRNRISSKNNGFTLVEFLIALVVIGFIVGLLVNYFSNPLKEAKASSVTSEVIQDGTTFVKAANAYYAKYQKLPSLGSDVVPEFLGHDLSQKSYQPYLWHAGWYPYGTVNTGNGKMKDFVIFAMGDTEAEINVCKKINAEMAGLPLGTDIPVAGGDVFNWASTPPEIAGRNTFCVQTDSVSFIFYMAL